MLSSIPAKYAKMFTTLTKCSEKDKKQAVKGSVTVTVNSSYPPYNVDNAPFRTIHLKSDQYYRGYCRFSRFLGL